jgi:hypothetical protein
LASAKSSVSSPLAKTGVQTLQISTLGTGTEIIGKKQLICEFLALFNQIPLLVLKNCITLIIVKIK